MYQSHTYFGRGATPAGQGTGDGPGCFGQQVFCVISWIHGPPSSGVLSFLLCPQDLGLSHTRNLDSPQHLQAWQTGISRKHISRGVEEVGGESVDICVQCSKKLFEENRIFKSKELTNTIERPARPATFSLYTQRSLPLDQRRITSRWPDAFRLFSFDFRTDLSTQRLGKGYTRKRKNQKQASRSLKADHSNHQEFFSPQATSLENSRVRREEPFVQ